MKREDVPDLVLGVPTATLVTDIAQRVPLTGLPIYDNLTGRPDLMIERFHRGRRKRQARARMRSRGYVAHGRHR